MAKKKKIAILGGGMGALAAAFELTSQEGWKDRYQITVYQMGWRLGGKGASGRNRKRADRIEEHGLHLWFGFYHNAFWLMRRCYQELGRKPGSPLATMEDAFKPYPFLGVMEQVPGEPQAKPEWLKFIGNWETDPEKPGTTLSAVHSSPWEIVKQLVTLAQGAFSVTAPSVDVPNGAARPSVWRRAAEHVVAAGLFTAGLVSRNVSASPRSRAGQHDPISRMDNLAIEDLANAEDIADTLDEVRDLFWDQIRHVVDKNTFLRRSWVLFDLAVSVVRGMVKDGVVTAGWSAIDDQDFREWIARWGANRLTLNHSLVLGCYDFVFAYRDGDQSKKDLAAGPLVRFMAGMLFDYQGSLAWAMQAGMGDTVFGPFYEVLKRRGVVFKFFHKVRRLELDAKKERIDKIHIEKQVTLKKPRAPYQPLYNVKGLPCWPSEPLYEQIQDGQKLENGWVTKGYDLESAWSTWPSAGTEILEYGTGFHAVVLGIPVGALSDICAELRAHGKEIGEDRRTWEKMVKEVPTVATMAMQLWLRPDLAGLGWEGGPAVVDGYEWPHSTYADLSHLICRERWPARADAPGSLAYFCGALGEATVPDKDPHVFPAQQLDVVKRESRRWLEKYATALWPRAGDSNQHGQLNYDLLVDPDRRKGARRLESQFFRANVNPSDRYVLTPSGSTKYRLKPDDSGYDNLYLAGDWTDNPLNTGCVEGAAMSGMIAARALSEAAIVVAGEIEPPLLRPHLGLVEVEGEYEASIAALSLPASKVRDLLPRDFTLDPLGEHRPPGSTELCYRVLIACGERYDARVSVPRLPPLSQFLRLPRIPGPETYKEAMIAIPYVMPKSSTCGCGRPGPFLYVPKFYVGSLKMALGGRFLWRMDIEHCDIWQDVRSGTQGDSWGVKDSRTTQETIFTLASHTEGSFKPLKDFSSFHQVKAMLSQPLLYSSPGDRQRTACAEMVWNLDQAVAKPATMDLRFALGFLQGGLKGSYRGEPLSDRAPGSFFLRRQSWRLSLPHSGGSSP